MSQAHESSPAIGRQNVLESFGAIHYTVYSYTVQNTEYRINFFLLLLSLRESNGGDGKPLQPLFRGIA